MAKVSIGTPQKARAVPPPPGMATSGETWAWFDGAKDPLHLHQHLLPAGTALEIGPMAADCVTYVYGGSVMAGSHALTRGSSLVVEHGARLALVAGADGASVLTFAAARAADADRAGGHVHLLPDAQVPRYAPEPGASGASGGLHFNGECPSCQVWLHENHMPGMATGDFRAAAEGGVHSHSEDEIIFITGGAMRLGTKMVGPGTALAIAADTFYAFTPGPEGLSFINFRAGRPQAFRMKSGGTFDEAGYWKARVSPPSYLAP